MSRKAMMEFRPESVADIPAPHQFLPDGGEEIVVQPLNQIDAERFFPDDNFGG